ncbi:hypothetical protein PAE9249_05255 [Paenibacillus sp. CECT 9249]|nr:hypothetical protein PAE9249_05255 [Paenibacillus sp. CECT 9249]
MSDFETIDKFSMSILLDDKAAFHNDLLAVNLLITDRALLNQDPIWSMDKEIPFLIQGQPFRAAVSELNIVQPRAGLNRHIIFQLPVLSIEDQIDARPQLPIDDL